LCCSHAAAAGQQNQMKTTKRSSSDTRTKLTQLGPSSMLYALLCVFDNTLQEQTFIGGTTNLIELWEYTIRYKIL